MSRCHDEYPGSGAPPEPVVPVPVEERRDVGELVVLVAESDRPTMNVIRQALEADLRFGRILAVTSGDEAVQLSPGVDMVVVDLRLSSGLGSLGIINRIAHRPVRPLIVGLSRPGDEWLCQAARGEGADDILEWPDAQDDLSERLAHATQAGQS